MDRSVDGAASTLPRGKTLEHSFFSSTCSINPLFSTNTPQPGHVAIAPTPRVLDACLAAPHAVQLSLIQRLHALSGARPSYDLFVERCVSTNLAEENYDEARRAAYVLEQMWPDADVSAVFEEYGAELY